jgi:predicted RNase H-like nuclease (RuvC/YqgF family)
MAMCYSSASEARVIDAQTEHLAAEVRRLMARIAQLERGGREQGRLCPHCARPIQQLQYHERGDCQEEMRQRIEELERELETLRTVLHQ